MSLKNLKYLTPTLSLGPTTSTGAGTVINTAPLSVVAAQIVVAGTGTGSFTVEGSLVGTSTSATGLWTTIIAASTYTGANPAGGRIVRSSTIGPVTAVRARVSAHSSTKDFSIYISGR